MYKTILVPLDGSPRAETILSHAASLAAKYQAKLVLLQVVEPIVAMVTPYDMVPYVDKDAAERSMEEAKSYLAAKEGELRGQGIEVKSIVESGPSSASSLTPPNARTPTWWRWRVMAAQDCRASSTAASPPAVSTKRIARCC